MPEHETPELFPAHGVSDVPEAPQPTERSELRRTIIDPGVADGRQAQQIIQGARRREPELPNAVRADTGYSDDRAEEPLPEIVTHGWSPLLGRAVQGDADILAQQSIIDGIIRAQESRERQRMDAGDRERARRHLAELHAITDPDGAKAARKAARAALEAAMREDDDAWRHMDPPNIPRAS